MKQTLRIVLLLFFSCIVGSTQILFAQSCTVTASVSNTNVCSGQTVTLTGNASFAASGWEWYREGEDTPVSSLQAFETGVAGKYKVVASGSECGETASNLIEILATTIPAAPGAIRGLTQVCSGEETTYQIDTVEGAESYVWAVPAGWQITGGQGSNVLNVRAGDTSGLISVYATNSCGASSATSVTVQVSQAISNNTIASNQTVCEGQAPGAISGSVPTGGNGLYTYQWESSTVGPDAGFTVVMGANGQNYQPAPLANTTWYRRKVASGCYQSISNAVKVTVAPAPAKPAANDASVAYGTAATLSVASPLPDLTYKWYSAAAGGAPLAAGATYTTSTLTANATFYVEATSMAGCVSGRTAVAVTVNAAITNNSIASDQSICAGQVPAALTGSVPAGGSGSYTYLWEHSQDGSSFSPVTDATSKDYAPGALNHTTWFRRKVNPGSEERSTSNSVKVAVSDVPAAPVVTGTTVCHGYSARLKVQEANPAYTYRWYLIGRDDQLLEGPEIVTVPITTDTLYYVEAINTAGCVSPRTKYIVREVPPFSENNVGEPQQVCAGEIPEMLGGLAPQDGSTYYAYLWEASTDGVNYAPAPNVNNIKFYQPDTLTETTWFRRSIVSEFCPLSVSVPVKVTVLPQPAKPGITQHAAQLTASVAGAQYEWYKDEKHLANEVAQSITVTESGLYKVRVQSEQGCYSDFSDVLQVTAQPTALAGHTSRAGVTISPNPTTGKVVLHTQQPLQQAQVIFVSIAGKEMYSQVFSSSAGQAVLDATHLPAGMYVVYIKTANLKVVQRLMLTK